MLRLKLLQTDAKTKANDVYYVDNQKRIWLQTTTIEGSLLFVRPERFDIYAHICKINNLQPKTQIYNSYSTFDPINSKTKWTKT
jgi:hypothetical protein